MEKRVKKPIVFIKSYGCAFNRFRAERLKDHCQEYFFVHNQPFGSDRLFFRDKDEEKIAAKAEYCVIYTCPITKYLEKMSADFISNIVRLNKKVKVFIAGCSLSCAGSSLINKQKNKNTVFLSDAELDVFFEKNKKVAVAKRDPFDGATRIGTLLIKIGCNNYCSYCVCPQVNKLKNISFSEIKKDIENIQQKGFAAIEFAGPCVGDWINPENKKFKFTDLVRYILLKTELQIVNLELYPTDFIDDLIKLLAKDKINKDISMPIQSGSDRMLRLMGRKYDQAILQKILDKLFYAVPGLQLTTDIIVGFPGETKLDLAETLDFLKKFDFYRIDIYKYSDIKKMKKISSKNQPDYFSEMINAKKYAKIKRVINLTSK